MSDITERLREWSGRAVIGPIAMQTFSADMAQAADEIERLRAALDRAAFRTQMLVDRMPPDEDGKSSKALAQTYVDDMRAALGDQP